jgi:hypothetical protein
VAILLHCRGALHAAGAGGGDTSGDVAAAGVAFDAMEEAIGWALELAALLSEAATIPRTLRALVPPWAHATFLRDAPACHCNCQNPKPSLRDAPACSSCVLCRLGGCAPAIVLEHRRCTRSVV